MAEMTKPTIDFDKETDVAYILRGEPKATWNFAVGDFTIRIDLDNVEVVGLDITNFSAHHPKLVKEIENKNMVAVEEYFDLSLQALNKNLLESFVKERGLAPAYETYLQSEAPRFLSGQRQAA